MILKATKGSKIWSLSHKILPMENLKVEVSSLLFAYASYCPCNPTASQASILVDIFELLHYTSSGFVHQCTRTSNFRSIK